MRKTFLIAAAAAFLLTSGNASAQYVGNQDQVQTQQGRRYGPNDGTCVRPQPRDGTGYGAKAGKRAGQNRPGAPQGAQRRGGRR